MPLTPTPELTAALDALAIVDPGDLVRVTELLRDLVGCLNGAAPLDTQIIRTTAIRLLTDRAVPDARSFVSAAFAERHTEADAIADALQGHALTLQDPEPWPDPVEGPELLEDLVRTLARFAALPEGGATLLALWTLHAHTLDAVQVSPILAITSPEKECGKTTVLTLLLALAPRPLLASNISTAGVFRVVDRFHPTLLVDEADTFLRDNEELRGVLNSGHFRAAAVVVRNVGDDFEPRAFSTWCAKAIALIGQLPDTLVSRSVALRMRRATAAEAARLDGLRLDRLGALEPLRRRAWRWAQTHLDLVRTADPELPTSFRGRVSDNWRPLLAIAELVGEGWPERARRAAILLAALTREEDEAPAVQLLADLRELFTAHGERLASQELVDWLVLREDRPWPEWRQGKPLTARQLAKLLKRFDLKPGQLKRGGENIRGYDRVDFTDAFTRYLPPESAPVADRSATAPGSATGSATGDLLSGEALSPPGSGVADKIPPPRRDTRDPDADARDALRGGA